jgi:hypothetical protein
LALLDGHRHEAVELIEASVAPAEEVGRPDFALLIARERLFLPPLYLGEPERLLRLVSDDPFNTRKPAQDGVVLLIAAVCLSSWGVSTRPDNWRNRYSMAILMRCLSTSSKLRLQLAVLWEDGVAPHTSPSDWPQLRMFRTPGAAKPKDLVGWYTNAANGSPASRVTSPGQAARPGLL